MLRALRNRFSATPASQLRAIVREANRAITPFVDSVPSVISPPERDLLRRIARDYYTGEGLIIDAGVFPGTSTNVFAGALRDRPDAARLQGERIKPIQSYALGVCGDTVVAGQADEHHQASLKPDGSFLSDVRQDIVGALDFAHLNEGDICRYSRPGPCEVVFLNICKTKHINQHTVRTFYSDLIPGRSVLIHRDFVHEWLPWVHVTMGALAPYFEFIGTATSSAVWLNTKRIPDAVLNADPYETASLSRLHALFDRAIGPLQHPVQRVFLEQARALMNAERGAKPLALHILDRIEPEWHALKKAAGPESHLLAWTNPEIMRNFISTSRRPGSCSP